MATAARVNIDTEVKYALGFALAPRFYSARSGTTALGQKNHNKQIAA